MAANRFSEMRLELEEILLYLKEEGVTVYLSKDKGYRPYGLLTDGTHVVNIQFGYFGGVELGYCYKPTLQYGSGVGYTYADGEVRDALWKVSAADFKACVKFGKAYVEKHSIPEYSGIKEYLSDPWHAKCYGEPL